MSHFPEDQPPPQDDRRPRELDGRAVFEILVRENADMLDAYLRTLLRSNDHVDDLFQEAMLIAWRRLADYDRSRPFGPWLRGIAQNLVLAHARRTNSAPRTMESGILAEIDARFDELANMPGDTFTERTQRIWECLKRLPDEMRETLELVCLRSVPVPAAAEELGSNRETVWKRVQRGRRLLAACLGLAAPEEAP